MTQLTTGRQLTLKSIAAGSGVPYKTLEKIARGEIVDPRISTVQKLVDFFQSRHRLRRPPRRTMKKAA